jgi:hypothetical protein
LSSSKIIGLAAGGYLYEAQNPIILPPLHTVYVYTVYLFTQGRGRGGEVNQREGQRGNMGEYSHKDGLKIPK